MNANNYILSKSLLALLAVALLAGGSLAAPILDQSQTNEDWYAAIDVQGYFAQTFTPAISGQLDHIELLIGDVYYNEHSYHYGPPTPAAWPATISIVETVSGGAPSISSADVLGQVLKPQFVANTYRHNDQYGNPVYGNWNSIDFLAESVTLTAGTLYAIVISNDYDSQFWTEPTDVLLIQGRSGGEPEPYSGGLMWQRLRSDPHGPWDPWSLPQSQNYDTADIAFKTYMVPEPFTLVFLSGPALALLFFKRKRTNQACTLVRVAQAKPSRILNSDTRKIKMTKSLTLILIFAFGLAFASYTDVSKAGLIQFDTFTSNGIYSGDIKVLVDVFDPGDGKAHFKFYNESSVPCSIEGIYFDDGALLGLAAVTSGPGTAFSQGANPGNLPGGNNLLPPFETTEGFLADSDPPVSHNGIEPGNPQEWVELTFDLLAGADINTVFEQLEDRTLRIGLHVIGLPDGSSESTINPEPTTLLLLAMPAVTAIFTRKSPFRNNVR